MNSQKADLHLVLNENNFNYDDFEIVASTARTVGGDLRGDEIRLKETGYYFAIYPNVSDYEYEKFLIEFSPGKEQITEHDLCGSWDLVVYAFVQYLSFLKRELSTIDPWADVEKFSEALHLLPTTVEPNASTSEVERRAIWKALTAIQATLLIHAGESREKQEFIKQHFEILENAATKFAKRLLDAGVHDDNWRCYSTRCSLASLDSTFAAAHAGSREPPEATPLGTGSVC